MALMPSPCLIILPTLGQSAEVQAQHALQRSNSDSRGPAHAGDQEELQASLNCIETLSKLGSSRPASWPWCSEGQTSSNALQRPTHGFDYLQHINQIVAEGLVGWELCCPSNTCSAQMRVSPLELGTGCSACFPARLAECQQETNKLDTQIAMNSGTKGTKPPAVADSKAVAETASKTSLAVTLPRGPPKFVDPVLPQSHRSFG